MAAVANNPKFAKQVGIKQSVGEDFMKADKGRKFAKGGITRHEDEAMDKKMIKKAVTMHDKQLHGGKKTDLAKLKKGGMTFAGKESKAEEAKEKKMFGSGAAYKKAEAKYEGERMKKGGKIKKYEDGGLTFADMPEEDRASQARAAMDAINARQAAASEAAGGASTTKTTPRRPIAAKAPVAKPTVKSVSVTKEEITGTPAAKPKTAGMKSLEEYSARSPWNTRGKTNIYGSGSAKTPMGTDIGYADVQGKAPRAAGMKKGGSVGGASKRADGCATKGKTKGTMVKMCGGGYAKKGK